jgi:DNA (cytosine-5)-methyltransferase 1
MSRDPSALDSGGSPRLLDLFCGAGGAARGYQRAGFYVVGVDVKPQPRYAGDEFIQADALTFPLTGFDVIHASPPCQAFTQMSARWRGKGTKADEHLDLLTPTRDRLVAHGDVYVIENVVGAKHAMRTDLMLHGGMFGLGVHRPRRFESNVLLMSTQGERVVLPIGVYGAKPDGRTTYRYRNAGKYRAGEPGSARKSLIRAAKSVEEARQVMGIDWMTDWRELCEAIPPAYTQYIGEQLMTHLQSRAA